MTRQDTARPLAHVAHTAPARRTTPTRHTGHRRNRRPMAYAVVAAAALTAVLGVYPLLDRGGSPVVQAVDDVLDTGSTGSGSTDVAGGDVPGGQATLDDDLPAITGLDPELAAAVRQAAGGDALDIGPTAADYWMIQHGAEYGLCQVYANKIWHFELLAEPGGACPPLREDSSAG